jgi:hypothetical protein
VYTPPTVITPTLASPPGIPSTFHVTDGSVPLTTVAANGCVWVVRIEGAAGVTVTSIAGGGSGGGGLATILPVTPPPQLAKRLTASSTSASRTLVSGLGELIIAERYGDVSTAALLDARANGVTRNRVRLPAAV